MPISKSTRSAVAVRLAAGLALAWICAGSAAGIDGPLTIAVWQGPCADGDFPANLATARDVAKRARAAGADFLAMPETFLSGYVTPERAAAGARRLDDPELTAFIRESSEHDMVILVGAVLRDEAPGRGEILRNSVLVIHRGALLGTYDKTMLTGYDRDVVKFEPGSAAPVFEARGVKFGVVVCHDSSFLHPALAARLQGAELLFSPHYNFIGADGMDRHRLWVRNAHVGLAAHLRMVVARPNVVVTDVPGAPGYGDSFILGAEGQVLAAAPLFKTELVVAKIGPEEFGRKNPWADDAEIPAWLRRFVAERLADQAGLETREKAKPKPAPATETDANADAKANANANAEPSTGG